MTFNKYLTCASMAVLLVACSDDDDSPNTTSGISYAFKASGETQPEYLVTQEDIMSGTLSAQGTGYEQLGWNFYYPVGNTLFVSGYDNFEAISYAVDGNKDVSQLNAFVFDKPLEQFGSVDGSTLIASDAPRDMSRIRTLYTADASSGKVTAKTSYSIFDIDTGTAGEGVFSWPSALVVNGDKLFVSFILLDDAGYWSTPTPNKALVAVYDYPLTEGAQPVSIIEDTRTSNIGVNGVTTGLIQTDNGDLYSFSNGSLSAGFSPASSLPSGILKIANGTTEFDADYFFNITEATNGGSVLWFDYIGENKAIARILIDEDACTAASTPEANACTWAAFGRDFFNHKLVILDLAAKTITDIADVPLHAKRYSSPVEVMNGKIYTSIETLEDAYVYQIDIATATAVKGAKIEGKTVKGFYNLYQ